MHFANQIQVRYLYSLLRVAI